MGSTARFSKRGGRSAPPGTNRVKEMDSLYLIIKFHSLLHTNGITVKMGLEESPTPCANMKKLTSKCRLEDDLFILVQGTNANTAV